MKPLLLTYALLCGADSGTTHYGLLHGAREVWLPTQNPYVIHALIGAQFAGITWGTTKLNNRGEGKLARRLLWVVIAARAGTVAWNAHQVMR